MACYEGTNITGGKTVKDAKMQLIDALIAFYGPRESSSFDSQPESKRAGERLNLTGYFFAVKILVFG